MSRVLVTGATGFVGSAVVQVLLRRGHEVHAVARQEPKAATPVTWHVADLLDPREPARVANATRADKLLHLAWYAEPGRYWTSTENVRWLEATLGLLTAFAGAGGCRAVMAGSCAEYQWGGSEVLSEKATPLRPATLYGACKHATQVVAGALAQQLEIEHAWGRIFFLYGPGEDPARLVASVARGLLAGQRVPTTPGDQVRDFLHVEDVAGGFVALLESGVTGPVNIASGAPTTVREVVAEIGAATGRSELIDFGALEPRKDEPPRIVGDPRRLRQSVGFTPRVGLAEGIRQTVEWWRARPSD